MLTIGEFSNICRVSTKTLRYYAEIGLILPDEINPKNGYRYYSIDQLERMLLINRLKDYCFSLEEIKLILDSEEQIDEALFTALNKKKKEIAVKVQKFEDTMHQIDSDISNLRNGKSIMSYMESIDVRLVEIPMMYLLSIRKNVLEHEFSEEYGTCFGQLFRKMEEKKLTDVLEQARQIDLFSYLRAYEPSNLVKVKGTTNVYCTAEHDSLKISNGKWYWWSRGFGGYSALDYLMKVKEYGFVGRNHES